MASQPGRERDYADATSRSAAEIQTAMVSIRRLGHETEFFRRSLRLWAEKLGSTLLRPFLLSIR